MKFRTPHESPTMMGERVDPTLPLEKQVYVYCLLIGKQKPSSKNVASIKGTQLNFVKLSFFSISSCYNVMHSSKTHLKHA